MKSLWLFLSLVLMVLVISFKKSTQETMDAMEAFPSNFIKKNYTENLLLIGMQVKGVSFTLRNIIRKTLMKLKYFHRNQVKLLFVIALPSEPYRYILPAIMEEKDTFQDILFIDDIVDGWRQIGEKHARFLQYVAQTDYLFSMKLDDDAYLYLEYLINFLEDLVLNGKSNDFYCMGKVFRNVKPTRVPSSKYYVSWEEFPYPIHPTFVLGYGSVYSNSLIKELFSKGCTDYVLFMEDAMFGVWMDKYLNLIDAKEIHFIDFEYYGIEMQPHLVRKFGRPPNGFYNLIHHISEDQLECFYECDIKELPFIEKYKCIDTRIQRFYKST